MRECKGCQDNLPTKTVSWSSHFFGREDVQHHYNPENGYLVMACLASLSNEEFLRLEKAIGG